MANMNQRMRSKLYPILIHKMGEQCVNCGIGLFELKELGKQEILIIDHIDNNNANNAINNLQLLCRGCNTKKNWSRNSPEPTTRDVPIELERSITNKKKAKKYIWGRMQSENWALKLDELLDDLSEYLGNSQQANKNYIKAFTSKKHGMFTIEERNGELYLVPKNDEELDTVIESFKEDQSVE